MRIDNGKTAGIWRIEPKQKRWNMQEKESLAASTTHQNCGKSSSRLIPRSDRNLQASQLAYTTTVVAWV